jgi:hypothetical protein
MIYTKKYKKKKNKTKVKNKLKFVNKHTKNNRNYTHKFGGALPGLGGVEEKIDNKVLEIAEDAIKHPTETIVAGVAVVNKKFNPNPVIKKIVGGLLDRFVGNTKYFLNLFNLKPNMIELDMITNYDATHSSHLKDYYIKLCVLIKTYYNPILIKSNLLVDESLSVSQVDKQSTFMRKSHEYYSKTTYTHHTEDLIELLNKVDVQNKINSFKTTENSNTNQVVNNSSLQGTSTQVLNNPLLQGTPTQDINNLQNQMRPGSGRATPSMNGTLPLATSPPTIQRTSQSQSIFNGLPKINLGIQQNRVGTGSTNNQMASMSSAISSIPGMGSLPTMNGSMPSFFGGAAQMASMLTAKNNDFFHEQIEDIFDNKKYLILDILYTIYKNDNKLYKKGILKNTKYNKLDIPRQGLYVMAKKI